MHKLFLPFTPDCPFSYLLSSLDLVNLNNIIHRNRISKYSSRQEVSSFLTKLINELNSWRVEAHHHMKLQGVHPSTNHLCLLANNFRIILSHFELHHFCFVLTIYHQNFVMAKKNPIDKVLHHLKTTSLQLKVGS